MSKQDLRGKVAVITGGGRGIGLAIAQAMAKKGVAVGLWGRNKETLDAAAQAIVNSGGQAFPVVCDVADKDAILSAVAETEKALGPISILVNNAGVQGPNGPFWTNDPDEWWHALEVNLKGPMLCTHALLPQMREAREGCVINVGSYIAIDPCPPASAYSTSKAALLRLTDSIAEGVRDVGVTVFAISPGYVWTDMTKEIDQERQLHDPNYEPPAKDWTFLPEDAANLCLRLASGEADKLTGRMIHVRDDLDTMIETADDIIEKDQYALRLTIELDD